MAVSHVSDDYEVVLTADPKWLTPDFKAVREYQDLVFLLVRRDFVSKFKQTILGPAWFFIQPIITTLVFTVIFGKVAGLSTDGLPQPLFYMCGVMFWNYFSGCFTSNSNLFLQNMNLFTKVYFPRLCVPMANILSNLLPMAIQLVTFLCFWLWYKWQPETSGAFQASWSLLAFPLVVIQVALLGLGSGLWMAALTAKYRDLNQLTNFIIQIWMYATPVIYPLSQIPEKWAWVTWINPMTTPVECVRLMFLGAGTVTPEMLVTSILMTIAVAWSGLILFQRVERNFVDVI